MDAGGGHVNAVQKLYQIDNLSQTAEGGPREPSLLQLTFLVITRAWGNDRFGAQGMILEGIARLFNEHGSKVDIDHLIDRLKHHPGGPRQLLVEARQFALPLRWKVSMAVSYLVTELYNKGKKNDAKSALPTWRKRV